MGNPGSATDKTNTSQKTDIPKMYSLLLYGQIGARVLVTRPILKLFSVNVVPAETRTRVVKICLEV